MVYYDHMSRENDSSFARFDQLTKLLHESPYAGQLILMAIDANHRLLAPRDFKALHGDQEPELVTAHVDEAFEKVGQAFDQINHAPFSYKANVHDDLSQKRETYFRKRSDREIAFEVAQWFTLAGLTIEKKYPGEK
jgi:hypothetical protein